MSDTTATVNDIIAYESGDMGRADTLRFFSELVRSGLAWQLQGSYGRQAAAFIDAGFITSDGTVTDAGIDWEDSE